MQLPSVIGLFCEDFREEKSGSDILVGILPDNINVLAVPHAAATSATPMLPRLAIYVRVHLDVNGPAPKNVTAKIVAADGHEVILPPWTNDIIAKGFEDSKASGMPLVGLLLKTAYANIPITKSGVMVIKVTIDDTDYIAANLRVILASSTESPQPALQSPSAS